MSKDAGYIVAIGSACVDEYYTLPQWIGEGDKAPVWRECEKMGGMIANAACVFAQLGHKTYLLDTLNTSPLSHDIQADLASYGVDCSALRIDPTLPDTKCMIFLTPGEKTLFAVDGCKPIIHPTPQLTQLLQEAELLYSTPYNLGKIHHAIQLVQRLAQHGGRLALDVESLVMEEAYLPLLNQANILFFNHYGYQQLQAHTGCAQPALQLLEQGAQLVVITQGKEGCVVFTPQGQWQVAGVSVPSLDPTGAGDTFNAAFLSAYLSGQQPADCARFATLAAARSVTLHGPRSGAVSKAEVETWAQQFLADGLQLEPIL